jgi:hypothetical protein
MFEPRVTDYVLVVGAYDRKTENSTRPIIEFNPPRQIDKHVWIGQIPHAFCEAVLDACEPPGENFTLVRQVGCSYAFYRPNAPGSSFDSDHKLFHCVALSRIVHPTSVGFAAAARVREYASGVREIIPFGRGASTSLNPSAFVMTPGDDWLIPDDLLVLGQLLDSLHAAPVSRRLEAALFHHEAVARHYYIDFRWPLLTVCLEALARIKDEKQPSGRWAGSTRVFVDRLLAIGKLDETLAVGEAELAEMYDRRSLLLHGLACGDLGERDRALYMAQEKLARGILRKIFLEPDFRDVFASDERIASRLPLRSRKR